MSTDPSATSEHITPVDGMFWCVEHYGIRDGHVVDGDQRCCDTAVGDPQLCDFRPMFYGPPTEMKDMPWGPRDVHTWFGLTYASYLVVNRSLLQSMPQAWQHRFTELMSELQHHFRNIDEPHYVVQVRTESGRFGKDPIPHYSRGRTFVAGADHAE